jgi:protein TonB
LVAPQGGSESTPLAPLPIAPPTATATNTAPQTISAAPTPAPAPAATVRWSSRPTARRIADLYPHSAARLGVGGRVELNCTVASSLGLNCVVASETPANLGFGRAALGVANAYRAEPTLSDGSGAVGARTRIAVQFQAPPR